MNHPAPLEIDGVRFARWAPADESSQFAEWRAKFIAREVVASIWVSVALYLHSTGIVAGQQLFLLYSCVYNGQGAPELALLLERWKRASSRRTEAKSTGNDSVDARAELKSNATELGVEHGVLTVEDGVVVFRGETMQFHVTKEDVLLQDSGSCLFGFIGTLKVKVPESCPPLSVDHHEVVLSRTPKSQRRRMRERIHQALALSSRTEPVVAVLPPIEARPAADSARLRRARMRYRLTPVFTMPVFASLITTDPRLLALTVACSVLLLLAVAKRSRNRIQRHQKDTQSLLPRISETPTNDPELRTITA